MKAVLERTVDGHLIHKAGVMATVHNSGKVQPDDAIVVTLPDEVHRPLEPV